VPGALIGALLYPLGLDSVVWDYVGAGIRLVLWAARLIGSAPGSTLHLHAFAPWALPFLTLAVLNAVIWRSMIFRALAIPCAMIGLVGATIGAPFDIVIPPTGESLAMRQPDGRLAIIGRHPSVFAASQWLAADGDGRTMAQAMSATQLCDVSACVQQGQGHVGPIVSVVSDVRAFEEDCQSADIIISNRQAPAGCKARWVFDSTKLALLGAVTLTYADQNVASHVAIMDFVQKSERSRLTDRPWSPSPATSQRAPAYKAASLTQISAPIAQEAMRAPAFLADKPRSNPVSTDDPASEDTVPFVDDDLLQ